MSAVNEAARLGSLRNLRLLDTIPSESFDRITRLVANFFNLPVSAVSLTDMNRQWFKAKVGITHSEIPRDRAPCAQVAETCSTLVINDFQLDDFYRDSHLGQAGIRFYAGAPLVTPDGHGLGALCVLGTEPRDVTQCELDTLRDLAAMVMAQVELQHAVGRIEAASGLPNRFQLLNDLEDMKRNEVSGTTRQISLLDLAHTAQFDRLSRVLAPGHLDQTIKHVARLLNDHVGDDGQTYHIGPTQFAFFAPKSADPLAYVEQLSVLLRQIEHAREFPMTITPSIGVMQFDPVEAEPDDVLRSLQSAMQDGRENETGIGQFSANADQRHRRNFAILQGFPDALDAKDQLSLLFQPRKVLSTGEMRSAEALIRWNHPELGRIPPSEFIPIVESSTFARQLTEWVLDESFRCLNGWKAGGLKLGLSINLSAANLEEHDFVQRLTAKMARYGIEPGEIELELTETTVMKETNNTLAVLEGLASSGIRLAMDDFGTGYSSLTYLQRLPLNVVKIDRSFVTDMANGNRERILVRSMVELSQSLGYTVVAEGVENEETAKLLEAMGCDEIQGYWLARPLKAEDMHAWLRQDLSSDLKMTA